MKNSSKKSKDETKVFAKGFCFAKIFIFFIIGCLIGTYWEELLWYIKYQVVVNRQGLIYGPFSPIYGFGVVIFIIFLGKNDHNRPLWKTFIYSFFLGGFSEYTTSLIADKIFNVSFWNYSKHFLNINGRTSIPLMIGWGIGGVIILKVIYPFISKWIEKIPYKFAKIAYPIFVTFIAIDMILTYGALGRMALRNNNIKPYTFIGELFDKYYSNDFLENKFPIMKPKK